MPSPPDGPALSVIVPAYRCADLLRECLHALRASDLPAAQWELIVVDDGSPDTATADVGRNAGAEVLRVTDGPRGPGYARNRGVDAARGRIVVFIDADVVVGPTTLTQLQSVFTQHPDVAAVFGSYDAHPRATGFVSQYRNLLHHWVHQRAAGPVTTFWAGCGAVRTSAFRTVGGFDAARFPRPQVEDIELGYRLTDRGFTIVLDPAIQVTHLKRWTLRSMVRADLWDRAVPWMQLLRQRGALLAHGPLSLRRGDKLLTLLTAVSLGGLVAGIVGARPTWLLASLVGLLAIVVADAPLLRWFARHRGLRFAVGAIPLRLTYYGVCAVGGTIGLLVADRGS